MTHSIINESSCRARAAAAAASRIRKQTSGSFHPRMKVNLRCSDPLALHSLTPWPSLSFECGSLLCSAKHDRSFRHSGRGTIRTQKKRPVLDSRAAGHSILRPILHPQSCTVSMDMSNKERVREKKDPWDSSRVVCCKEETKEKKRKTKTIKRAREQANGQ